MPPLPALPIHQGRVLRHAVVPDDDGALLPLDAGLEIGAVREMVVQELEERIRLLLLETDDVTCNCITCQSLDTMHARQYGLTLRVDVKRLLSSGRVRPDNRVLVDHRIAPLDAAPRSRGVDLLDAGVRGLQAVQPLLEQRAEAVVRLDGVDEERVAPGLGLVEDVQERGSGRLLLVRHVRVPRDRARARGEEFLRAAVSGAAMHEVDLGEPLRRAGRGVDVVAAEVAAKLERLLDRQVGEVLATEGDDLALGDEPRELVLARVAERAELDAGDLCADCGCQVRDFGRVLGQEVGECGVGVFAVLIVLEGLERWVFLLRVPRREVVGILQGVMGQHLSVKAMIFESRCGPYLCALESLLSGLRLRVELGRSQLLVWAEVGALGRVDHGDRDGLYCGWSHVFIR